MKYLRTRLVIFSIGVVFFVISAYAPFFPLACIYFMVSIFGEVEPIFECARLKE